MAETLFIVLGFGSCLVSATFGFGSALFVLAVGSYLVPIKETIALGAVLFAVADTSQAILLRKYVDWPVALAFALISIPFSYVGASLVPIVPTELLQKGLGLMALCYLIVHCSPWRIYFKPGEKQLFVVSGVYGFLSGFLGGGTVVSAIFFRETGLRKEGFVGLMAATSLSANITKAITYTRAGLINGHHSMMVLGLTLSALLAVFLGHMLRTNLPDKNFYHGTSMMLGVVAIGLLM